MASSGGAITVIDGDGTSFVVTITDASGASVSAFTDEALSTSIALPATITATTTFWLGRDADYTVSVTASGVEVANTPDGTRQVRLTGGERLVFKPNIDTNRLPDLSGTYGPAPKIATMAAAGQVLYQPSATSLVRWRASRDQTRAGLKQGHIAVVGDSIAFGAGNGLPKFTYDWPGQFRAALARRFGDAGSGLVISDANIRANPTWDTRWAFTGAGITDQGFGFHKAACFRMDGTDGATHIDFTADCSSFVVYLFTVGSAVATAQVDGSTVGTLSLAANGAGGTIARRSGYFTAAGNSHNVFDVPAGTSGTHTLRLIPEATGAYDTFLWGIEALKSTQGTFRVTNASINGKSLSSLFGTSDDETNGLWGLPLVDDLKSDLLIIALGINDWQSQTSITTVKGWLTTLIQRQRDTSSGKAAGDAVLVWNPQPDIATLGGGAYTNPTWDAYRAAYYEVADAEDVALIDLGGRWTNYATGNGLGLFADTIHPTDKGSADVAGTLHRALFEDC